MQQHPELLHAVEKYYSGKIREHGVSPKGVDWNSLETQQLRFEKLLKVVDAQQPFSLLDYGCGYGALLEYMNGKFSDFTYTGFDISDEMLSQAKQKFSAAANAIWTASLGDHKWDYTVASGIFNVKLNQELDVWEEYIKSVLISINNQSQKGFAFNMLTSYSDAEYMKDNLYYASPSYYFDFCKTHFSKYVALLHDYPLYEFTILVKK